jgi:hypothetical protein
MSAARQDRFSCSASAMDEQRMLRAAQSLRGSLKIE